jgi:hypothetical protein
VAIDGSVNLVCLSQSDTFTLVKYLRYIALASSVIKGRLQARSKMLDEGESVLHSPTIQA